MQALPPIKIQTKADMYYPQKKVVKCKLVLKEPRKVFQGFQLIFNRADS